MGEEDIIYQQQRLHATVGMNSMANHSVVVSSDPDSAVWQSIDHNGSIVGTYDPQGEAMDVLNCVFTTMKCDGWTLRGDFWDDRTMVHADVTGVQIRPRKHEQVEIVMDDSVNLESLLNSLHLSL